MTKRAVVNQPNIRIVFKGDAGNADTSESLGGAHMGFSGHIHTILSGTERNGTELFDRSTACVKIVVKIVACSVTCAWVAVRGWMVVAIGWVT